MSRLETVAGLISIDSVSRNESALASHLAGRLTACAHLEVERIGDNVVARTKGSHKERVLLAGHLDTVPGTAADVEISNDRVTGLGACDMKGSLAVMVEIMCDPRPRPREVTLVLYAREEIARSESGLVELFELRPDLMEGDLAILGEPTGGHVEAGCQGTLRLGITLKGKRAHTARPFTGDNAIHRMAALVSAVGEYVPRTVNLHGVSFTEQLQAVMIGGGIAPNVVPDECQVTLNHRVAPDRTRDEAVSAVTTLLASYIREGDEIAVLDWAPAAPPNLEDPRLGHLVTLTGAEPRGKVGWTDVATFSERGIPATNFGAGDPLLAHQSGEYVTRQELDDYFHVLSTWLARPSK